MQSFAVELSDLGGGVVEGIKAADLDNRQAAELFNFYPYGTKLKRRPGTTKVTSYTIGLDGGFGGGTVGGFIPLNSVFALKQATGDWDIIVGTQRGLARLDGTTLHELTATDGLVTEQPYIWDMHQYANTGYALRRGVGMRRFTRDTHGPAGIAAPSLAPVIAAGSVGTIEAADYIGVYTYINRDTGVESNPSPASNVVTLSGAEKAAWSNLIPSSNAQVNGMRLYRTEPNQVNEYFFTIQIDDNTTTAIEEDIVLNNLGRPVSFDNGVPPLMYFGCIGLQERFWGSDGTDLFFSERNLMECFAGDSILAVEPDNGAEIRGLTPFGSRIIVGKTNKIYGVTETGPRTFEIGVISDRHGLYSHFSFQSAEGNLFWEGENDFYRYGGADPVAIGDKQIRKTLDRINPLYKQYAVGTIYEPRNQYIVTVPLDGSGNNSVVLVHNYRDLTWTKYDHQGDAPAYIASIVDANFQSSLYATFYDGHLYKYLQGRNDAGIPIVARWKSKAINTATSGGRGFMYALRHLMADISTVPEQIKIQVFLNGSDSPLKERVVDLLMEGKDWKAWSLNTTGQLGSELQVGVEYSGDSEIDLNAFALDIAQYARRATRVL